MFRRTGQIVDIYLEGMDFNKLNPHSVVLVRGRGPRDVPGVSYHAIRGKGDFPPLLNRRKGRSKYGAKRPKIPQATNSKNNVILTKENKRYFYRFLAWKQSVFKNHVKVSNRY
jgi:hypothetical protein